MEKIKLIINELSIREICLSVTGEYYPSKTSVERKLNNDIIITVDTECYTDKIYGREIDNKYYFARTEHIKKGLPEIDYYEEFFSNGQELKFQL